jgi:hypothetical protein
MKEKEKNNTTYVNMPRVTAPTWKLEALLEPLASIPLKQVQ